jgi:hypothetical protein
MTSRFVAAPARKLKVVMSSTCEGLLRRAREFRSTRSLRRTDS